MKKRVLKSQYKNVKYEANSFSADCKAKSQGSDYYVGVYDPSRNKCYLVPIKEAY